MKPNLKEEKILWRAGFKYVAGLDEVGRGPLAGPVVAACVMLNDKSKTLKCFKGINDSKKLSEKKREDFYKILTDCKNVKWGIGIVSEKVIDKINILEATKMAMQLAIKDLGFNADFLLLDGNFKIKSDVPQKSIIKGDQRVISISAASIIAKVTRDKIMEKYDKKYPQYGFGRHKGYPTEFHIKMLQKYGACPIHRKSFRPVTELLDCK